MNCDGTEFFDIISKLNKDFKNEFIRADTDLRSLINNFGKKDLRDLWT